MRQLFVFSMASVDLTYLLGCLINAVFMNYRDKAKGWQVSDTRANFRNYFG
jgi:hypothetical protein